MAYCSDWTDSYIQGRTTARQMDSSPTIPLTSTQPGSTDRTHRGLHAGWREQKEHEAR